MILGFKSEEGAAGSREPALLARLRIYCNGVLIYDCSLPNQAYRLFQCPDPCYQ